MSFSQNKILLFFFCSQVKETQASQESTGDPIFGIMWQLRTYPSFPFFCWYHGIIQCNSIVEGRCQWPQGRERQITRSTVEHFQISLLFRMFTINDQVNKHSLSCHASSMHLSISLPFSLHGLWYATPCRTHIKFTWSCMYVGWNGRQATKFPVS